MEDKNNQAKKEHGSLLQAIGTQKLVAIIALVVLFLFFWFFLGKISQNTAPLSVSWILLIILDSWQLA